MKFDAGWKLLRESTEGPVYDRQCFLVQFGPLVKVEYVYNNHHEKFFNFFSTQEVGVIYLSGISSDSALQRMHEAKGYWKILWKTLTLHHEYCCLTHPPY